MAYLLVTSGPSAGTSFNLKQCPLSVGRDVTRDVQLLDMQVSRKHFTVDRTKAGDYTVKVEPNARNGMMVNDQVVAEATLKDGDRVRIGETEMEFLATNEPGQLDAIKRTRVWSKQSTAQTIQAKKPS